MKLHLEIIGVLLILLATLHIGFPKYFNWKKDLQLLSVVNRQMFYVHSFFIALTVLLVGLLCLTSAKELCETPFGKRISLFLALFWMLRLLAQFFGFNSQLWKGRKFETTMHIIFTIFWTYVSTIFLIVYLH